MQRLMVERKIYILTLILKPRLLKMYRPVFVLLGFSGQNKLCVTVYHCIKNYII